MTDFRIERPVIFGTLNFKMKLFLLVTLATVASAHPGNELKHEHANQNSSDGNGIPHSIDLQEHVKDADAFFARNVDTITFNLYTRNNPATAQILTLNSTATVTNSSFLTSRPTRIVTHGWHESKFSDSCVLVRDAYLTAGDYNVIVVDWSIIAAENYVTAAGNVRNVALHISSFLNFLNENTGLQFNATTIVGFSLGGHIAGIAAQGASGDIHSVIALDPALPGFNNTEVGSGVHPSDADHVQVIHTNAGNVGLSKAAGDSDFYPNGGSSQPGCGVEPLGNCAHSRAYHYFAESITNPTGFPAAATRSGSLEALTTKSPVYMGGEYLSTHASGNYTLTTASTAPFALG